MVDSLVSTIRKSVPWFIQEPKGERLGWFRSRARGLRVDVRKMGTADREQVWKSERAIAVNVDIDRHRPLESLFEIEHWSERRAPTLITASMDSDLRDLYLLVIEAGAQDVIVGWDEPRRSLKLLSRFVEEHRNVPEDLWTVVASKLSGDFR